MCFAVFFAPWQACALQVTAGSFGTASARDPPQPFDPASRWRRLIGAAPGTRGEGSRSSRSATKGQRGGTRTKGEGGQVHTSKVDGQVPAQSGSHALRNSPQTLITSYPIPSLCSPQTAPLGYCCWVSALGYHQDLCPHPHEKCRSPGQAILYVCPEVPAVRVRRCKEHSCPELLPGHRWLLVVRAVETGSRWSEETVRLRAHARAGAVPPPLRQAATQGLIRRWTAILTHAAVAPLAQSLTGAPAPFARCEPWLPKLSDIVTCSGSVASLNYDRPAPRGHGLRRDVPRLHTS